jgi:hypothetical protein
VPSKDELDVSARGSYGIALRLHRYPESLAAQKPRALAEQEFAQFAGVDHVLGPEEGFTALG